MGALNVFPEMVELINRGREVITVKFDGEEKKLYPGGGNIVPRVVVPYAKKQNPIMGSENFYDPNDYKFLVSVKGGKKDPQEPLTDEEWEAHKAAPQRLNRQQIQDERGDPKSREVVRGKKVQNAGEARAPIGVDGAALGTAPE